MATAAGIKLLTGAAADVPTPAAGAVTIFLDTATGILSYKDSSAVVHALEDTTALATALALKANIASPTLTGIPAAPTAAPGTNTTQLSTTAFVTAAVAAGGAVTSVAGRTGVVVLVENDIGASTHDAGNSSTAITVDWSLARTQKITATGNATVTNSNMTAGIVYTVEYYTGAGSFTAAFASVNFAGGVAPTLTVTASKVDIFTLYKTIGGTVMGGVFGQSFAP